MDRRQFLTQTDLKDSTSPGDRRLEECICEQITSPVEITFQKNSLLYFVIITLLAFISACGISTFKIEPTVASVLQYKNTNSLSCATGNTGNKKDTEHSQPFNNSGKNCPHQSYMTCIACCGDQRRRSWQVDEDMA